MDEHAICKHCAHWDLEHAVQLPVYRDGKLVFHREYAACKVNAVEAEAGDCLPMMGAYGHCQWHGEAFQSDGDYLFACHEAAHANDGLPVMQLDPAEVRTRAHVA